MPRPALSAPLDTAYLVPSPPARARASTLLPLNPCSPPVRTRARTRHAVRTGHGEGYRARTRAVAEIWPTGITRANAHNTKDQVLCIQKSHASERLEGHGGVADVPPSALERCVRVRPSAYSQTTSRISIVDSETAMACSTSKPLVTYPNPSRSLFPERNWTSTTYLLSEVIVYAPRPLLLGAMFCSVIVCPQTWTEAVKMGSAASFISTNLPR